MGFIVSIASGKGGSGKTTMTEVNLVLAVTEPTLSGIHDLERGRP
jgi:MinD superfamily P-loop ATPase